MLLRTTSTYEASWYIINGGKLLDVEFKREAAKPGQFLTRTVWILVITDIPTKFVIFWKQRRPIGNIRMFSEARINLKHEIERIKKSKGYVSP